MHYIYVLFALAIIPLINYNRREDSGQYFLIFTSIFMGLWFMWHQIPIPWDPVTQATLGLCIFLASSVFWSTHYEQSIKDALSLISACLLFLTLRVVPAELSLSAVAIAASGVASGMLIDRILKEVGKDKMLINHKLSFGNHRTFFGNTNHTGFYCMAGLAAAAYMAVNGIQPIVAYGALALCGVGLIVSACRAAIIGTAAACMVYGIHQGHWIAVGCMAIATALVIWQLCRRQVGGSDAWRISVGARAAYIFQALFLATKRPLFGWGLRTYRVHSPDAVRMLRKDPLWHKIRKWYEKKEHASIGHRAHCDPLEFVVETGLAGLTMVGIVAVTLSWEDPVLASAMIGFVVGSCFFFPFREAHLLPAILVIAALMAPVGSGLQGPWVQIAVTLSACGILGRLGHRFYAEWQFHRLKVESHKGKDPKKIHKYIMTALDHDPYNNRYLCFGYWFHHSVLRNPEVAFKMASRALEHYDGDKIKHQMYDSYGKYALQLGTGMIASNAFIHALDLEPTHQPSLEGMQIVSKMMRAQGEQLQRLKKKRKKNGKPSRHRKQRANAVRG